MKNLFAPLSDKAVLVYSALGHAYFHMFTAFYFVIVLSLETEWRLPYHQLVNLWSFGALLVGAFALIAGWLGDKWSAAKMLAVYFIGMGACSIAAGFAETPAKLWWALSGIGLFAAIYHPVGIPLVIRNSGKNQGAALAVNGVFGSFGAALAGVVSGYLAQRGGSFLAFVLPGIVVAATGVLMTLGLSRRARAAPRAVSSSKPSAPGTARAPLLVLLFCLTAAGLIYHATQTVAPKVLSVRMPGNPPLTAVGWYVALIYAVGGLFQFIGGALADRCNLKAVYLWQFVAHAVLLLIAAQADGALLILALCAAVALGAGALPAENMLLARYTPSRHYGLVFGLKFVLFFCTGPVGVLLVAAVARITGQFVGVFFAMGMVGALICAAALALPRNTPAAQPAM